MVNLAKNNNNQEEQSVVAKILGVLWQRIFIVIIAVALALVAFFCYSKLKKPDYTAYEKVIFTVKNTAEKDAEGNIKENSTAHINSALKYADTVSRFFATGYVVDRANFYYNQFNKLMENTGYAPSDISWARSYELQKYIYTINGTLVTERILEDYKFNETSGLNKFIFNVYKNVNKEAPYIEKASYCGKSSDNYEFSTIDRTISINKSDIDHIVFVPLEEQYDAKKDYNYDYFVRSNIDVSYDDASENFCFSLSYVDSSNNAAREKVRFIALAANQEAKLQDKPGEYVYFNTLKVELNDIGSNGVLMNVSRKKMLVIFAVCGVALGIVAVYLSTLLDKSVTSKKDIEALTGVPLLAHIESIKENEK